MERNLDGKELDRSSDAEQGCLLETGEAGRDEHDGVCPQGHEDEQPGQRDNAAAGQSGDDLIEAAEAAVMTDNQAEVENVMRIVDKTVRHRWGGSPHLDDMRAEGYYQAWKSYRQAQEHGRHKPTTAAFAAARTAPFTVLRQWRGVSGNSREGKHALREEGLSLDALIAAAGDRALPAAVDPAPAVIERLAAEARVAAWLACCPAAEREALYRYYWQEETALEIGRAMSLTESRIGQLLSAGRKRIRAAFGITPAAPPPPRGRAKRTPAENRRYMRERRKKESSPCR